MAKKLILRHKLPRLFALKSDNIQDNNCKKFALLAKKVEEFANKIRYMPLAKVARQYKIEMKKAYEKYQKEIKGIQYSNFEKDKQKRATCQQECYATMAALAIKLVKVIETQAKNMLSIYNTAYQFSATLNGDSLKALPELPTATGTPNTENLEKIEIKQPFETMQPPMYEPLPTAR